MDKEGPDPQLFGALRTVVSYVWDDLIERFSHHLLSGTQYFASHPEVHEQEKGLKLLAQETRLARRMLGAALVEMLSSSPPDQRATRVMAPPATDAVTPMHYVVLILPRPAAEHMGSYREVRRQLLEQYCFLVKLDRPSATDVIGIAIEPLNSDESSEDLAYFDARQWTAADAARARQLKSEFIERGLLSDRRSPRMERSTAGATSGRPRQGLRVGGQG
ncbi:MAG: hypothetical protein JOZ05_18410 [Acetobacteraceae bacterium]|nr:hypothetical protein [Acetobacteraceae bacterium]